MGVPPKLISVIKHISKTTESVENSEKIDILRIQTEEPDKNTQSGQKPTSKSATIAPKVVANKSTPTKTDSKPEVEKIGWDTPAPPERATEFQEWPNESKVISEYSFERCVFGSANGKHSPATNKNSLELHIFVDGGGIGYRVFVFLVL